MGFGTFDGIHPGHLSYLKQLAGLGDEICVVVARDSNVQKIKGRAPRLHEKDRAKAVQKTNLANHVFMGNEKDFYKCITDHKPDVIGLGYDQKADIDFLKKTFPHTKVVRLKSFGADKHKSSLR